MFAVTSLCAVVCNEFLPFRSEQARLVGAAPAVSALAALDAAFVKDLAVDADSRRKLRPLLDLIAEAKRKASK